MAPTRRSTASTSRRTRYRRSSSRRPDPVVRPGKGSALESADPFFLLRRCEMAITESPTIRSDVPPDVRGPTAPLPATILALGIASLVIIAAGILFSQVNYALSDRVLTRNCIDEQISPEDNGAIGVCNIVEALQDPVTSVALYLGIGLGAVAVVRGAATYRRMDSKRRRDQAITGAVLGSQGILLAVFVLWFRSASPGLFAKHFLNFADLEGYWGSFVRAATRTLALAFGGELGGIVI